jgi:CopG family nickel-responsive transcriptional regulator
MIMNNAFCFYARKGTLACDMLPMPSDSTACRTASIGRLRPSPPIIIFYYSTMERLTISLDNQLCEQFDQFIHARGYTNRSEAMRDLIRDELESARLDKGSEGHCVATLSYIYNHHETDLASRVTAVQHDHHDLTLSSMHVHMDHDNCLEVVILRGDIQSVENFANTVMATRGVRHGKLHMVPVEIKHEQHSPASIPHTHSNPLT